MEYKKNAYRTSVDFNQLNSTAIPNTLSLLILLNFTSKMTDTKDYTVFRGIEGAAKAVLNKTTPLAPKEVLIKITHSGLCGTDVHMLSTGAALGHEGVGIIESIGSAVTTLKIGDRVGGGFHRNACGHCQYCLSGNDIWCYERTEYTEGDYSNGSLAEYFLGFETFVHKIPKGLSSEHAASLQCAGATVYSALVDVVKPFQRVGIIDIGGLGHLAIQYANKLGAEVVVFSTSRNKEAEAKGFGASEFYLLNETEKVTAPIDILVVAGSHYPDWDK